MADSLVSAKKILPCLLDRLTDGAEVVSHTPAGHNDVRIEEAARSAPRSDHPEAVGITLPVYIQSFKRDLAMLLNTKSHQATEALAEFAEAERSVINYGMRDPAGRAASRQDILDIERQIREAILRFEPRLAPETLRVRALPGEEVSRVAPNTVGFEIAGTLWASPMPEYFHVKTEINLENGRCSF